MAFGFKWKMGSYVGGSTAVHQAYKPWLALELEQQPEKNWAIGEFLVEPRATSDLVFTGLGFEPDVIFLISYRPALANNDTDAQFGARGGGMTFGVGGRACPDLAQFSGSSRIRHGISEEDWSNWREDSCLSVMHDDFEALRLELVSLDPDGFTLAQVLNLYDTSSGSNVAWLAMKGRFKVGVMSTGDTELFGVPGQATGAVFLSTMHTSAQINAFRISRWDHSQGFATQLGNQAAIWGGFEPTGWFWTTERWHDAHSILLCNAAQGGSFYNAEVLVAGRVADWWAETHSVTLTRSGTTVTVADTGHGWASGQCIHIAGATNDAYNGVHIITVTGVNSYTYQITTSPASPASGTITAAVGGVDLQYDTFDGNAYRVGYVLTGDPADSGVIETNHETRPGGAQNDFADGTNWVPTSVRPHVVLMQATNYNFAYNNVDPFDFPRSPNEWGSGGSGGLGWHAQPFSEGLPNDAFGVHTFGNGVAELGRYTNSGTQFSRNYILAGQGANSNPPAAHQHSVNIVPNPRYVGINYRYAERHAQVKRIHINQSDQYLP